MCGHLRRSSEILIIWVVLILCEAQFHTWRFFGLADEVARTAVELEAAPKLQEEEEKEPLHWAKEGEENKLE